MIDRLLSQLGLPTEIPVPASACRGESHATSYGEARRSARWQAAREGGPRPARAPPLGEAVRGAPFEAGTDLASFEPC